MTWSIELLEEAEKDMKKLDHSAQINGCIVLEPRALTVLDCISARTLEDMDRAISNFKMGEVSPAVDLSDF